MMRKYWKYLWIGPLAVASLAAPGCSKEEAPHKADPTGAGYVKATGPRQARNPLLYNVDTKNLLPRLVQKLEKAPDRKVLRWAIQKITEFGQEAIPELRRAFYRNFDRHEHFPALSNICEALGQIGSSKGVPILLDGLVHSSSIVRSRSMDSLIAIRDPDAFDYMANLFVTEAKENRVRMVKALAATGSEKFIPFAKDLWHQGGATLQEIAIVAVMEFHPEKSADFLDMVYNHEKVAPYHKILAARGLASLGNKDAEEYLVNTSRAAPFGDRIVAIEGLGKTERADVLLELAAEKEPRVQGAVMNAAARMLEKMGTRAPQSPQGKTLMGILGKFAQSPNTGLQKESIKVMVNHGDRSSLDPFLEILRSEPNPYKLQTAVELLIDPVIREVRAVPIAAERLPEAGKDFQRILMQVLGALHDERGVEPLLSIIRNPKTHGDDEYAALQLGFLGSPAVPALIEAAKTTKDAREYFYFLQALAWSKDPKASAFIIDFICDAKNSPEKRLAFLQQVPDFADLNAAPHLKRAVLREPHAGIRRVMNDILWDYF